MPQDAWILKCYSCKKYQVQLTKKAKKWQCKVCGAKQDVMTIYFKGQPSDCRVNVQKLNAAEGEALEKLQNQSIEQDETYDNYETASENEHYLMEDEVEDFSEEALAELDEQCNEIEQTYSQEIGDITEGEDEYKNDFSQYEVENENEFELESSDENDIKNSSDINKTIKNNSIDNLEQEPKTSIFESVYSSAEFLNNDDLDF